MDIRCVDFDDYAQLVRSDIDAIGAQCGRPELFETIRADCTAGRAFLFVAGADAFAVLLPYKRGDKTVVRVQAVAAKVADALEAYQPLLVRLAQSIGGEELEFWTARPGFDRLAPRLGWHKTFTIWSMDL